MKFFGLYIVVSLFMFSVLSCAQKNTVTQKITYFQPYCGGARPTPEMEAEAQKPKPYANQTVIIVSESGKIDSAKTDAEGGFKKLLKYGKYKLFESWKFYKKTPDGSVISNYDKTCLALEWKKEFKILSVSKTKITEEEKYQLNLKCPWSVPCILDQYLPPRRQ